MVSVLLCYVQPPYIERVNLLCDYFIGDYLRREPDLLKQASIRLVYHIVMAAIISLVFFFAIYIIKRYDAQLIKNLITFILFIGTLFYIKYTGSIRFVCHFLVIVSWLNNNINIYLFDDFNFIVALLTIADIIFAFHTLGSRAGVIYSLLHFLPILAHFMIRHAGIHLNSGPPQQLAYTEGIITLFLVFFIIVYLIYHYHQAYELARRAILQNMEDLEKAREIANVMNKLKANFLSNMSHEIRTPINGILGLSQVIALESKEEETRKYVAMQQQSGRRLLDTMTSILELSRLEAEQEEPRRKAVAINPLVEQCLAAVEERAREKRLDITFRPCPNAPQGLSDEHMLRQVIAHVIGNAVKFTDKGGILVETRLAEADPGMIMIRVTDTGIGITPEFMPRMYSPFEQESTGRSRSHEGTGLGLALAKKYIHSLKGEIRAQSEKGKGSVFTILLPAYTPA